MDSQDHKANVATFAGHEGHEAHYLCHRCGWPFPNPHPSAKHRRAHKKVCGTIEGYRIVQSEDGDDAHLSVTVDQHASDDEDEHSPSPKLVKEKSPELNGSSEVGLKSYKSEDDVFSDAVAGFSDSGLSQRWEESSEGVTGQEKNTDNDGVGDTGKISAVDENAGTTEQLNDPTRSSELEHVVYLTNNDDIVNAATLIGLSDSVKHDVIEDDMSVSETVKSGDTISEPAIMTAEVKQEPCDNLELDVTPQTESSEQTANSASEQGFADSAELTGSIETSGEKALVEEAHGRIEASVESNSIKNSDVESTFSSLDKEVTVDPALTVNSQLPNSNNETSDVAIESINGGGLVYESKQGSHVVISDVSLTAPCSKDQATSHLDLQDSQETCLAGDDKIIGNGEQNLKVTVGETKPQPSDTLKSINDNQKVKDVEAHQPDKSEAFEPPSLKTMDQSGKVNIETCSSETETLQNNQQPKSNALPAGQIPSLTNVVNESEDRKENEEITSKAMHHHPLKSLLDEDKSSKTIEDQKEEVDLKDNAAGSTTVKSILDQEAPMDQENNKDESDSPARYLIGNKKETKKKKKSLWVPFLCCSSVHRDL